MAPRSGRCGDALYCSFVLCMLPSCGGLLYWLAVSDLGPGGMLLSAVAWAALTALLHLLVLPVVFLANRGLSWLIHLIPRGVENLELFAMVVSAVPMCLGLMASMSWAVGQGSQAVVLVLLGFLVAAVPVYRLASRCLRIAVGGGAHDSSDPTSARTLPASPLDGLREALGGEMRWARGRLVVGGRRGAAQVDVVVHPGDLRIEVQVRPDGPFTPLDLEPRPAARDARLAALATHGCRRVRSLGGLIVTTTERRADDLGTDDVLAVIDLVLDLAAAAPPPLEVRLPALLPAAAAVAVCPWCRDSLGPDDAATTCERCTTRHHPECWGESGGCTVLGCRGRRERDVARA